MLVEALPSLAHIYSTCDKVVMHVSASCVMGWCVLQGFTQQSVHEVLHEVLHVYNVL